MSRNMKPCPFCGGRAKVEEPFVIIHCMKCDVRVGWFDSPEKTVAAWNRRTQTTEAHRHGESK
jgi:Fe-S-cluster-containing dehydrogenase component